MRAFRLIVAAAIPIALWACGKTYATATDNEGPRDAAVVDDVQIVEPPYGSVDTGAPPSVAVNPAPDIDAGDCVVLNADFSVSNPLTEIVFAVDDTYYYYPFSQTDDVGQTTNGVARTRLDGTGTQDFVATTTQNDLWFRLGSYLYMESGELDRIDVDDFDAGSSVVASSTWRPLLGDAPAIVEGSIVFFDRSRNRADLRTVDATGTLMPGIITTLPGTTSLYADDSRVYWLASPDGGGSMEFWYLSGTGSITGTETFIPDGVTPEDGIMVQPFFVYSTGSNLVRIDTSTPGSPATVFAAKPNDWDLLHFVHGGYLYFLDQNGSATSELSRLSPQGDAGTPEHVAWLPADLSAAAPTATQLIVAFPPARGEQTQALCAVPLP